MTIVVYQYTQPRVFFLMFESSDQKEFQKLIVLEGKTEREYIFSEQCSESFKECSIKVGVLEQAGLLNLKVVYKNGKTLSALNVEYYAGEANYISTSLGKLGWVRAHWQ